MKETTAMDKITEEMMEHVCDHLCRFPWEISDQEEMDAICDNCEMGKHVCNILNEYNRLNDFEQTQRGDLLARLGAEREKRRWIPVSERLPEESKRVLAAGRFDDIQVAYWDKQKWYLVINRRPYNYGPLAWMPLPEPYQLPVLTEAGESAGNYADGDTLASTT